MKQQIAYSIHDQDHRSRPGPKAQDQDQMLKIKTRPRPRPTHTTGLTIAPLSIRPSFFSKCVSIQRSLLLVSETIELYNYKVWFYSCYNGTFLYWHFCSFRTLCIAVLKCCLALMGNLLTCLFIWVGIFRSGDRSLSFQTPILLLPSEIWVRILWENALPH